MAELKKNSLKENYMKEIMQEWSNGRGEPNLQQSTQQLIMV